MGRYGYGRCLLPVSEGSGAAFRNLVPVVAGLDGGVVALEDGLNDRAMAGREA
jgi:hypothetical protein